MRKLVTLSRGAGPSRIAQHIQDGTPFITISAYRSENSHHENARRSRLLVQSLHHLPLSFIQVEGEFEETHKDGSKHTAIEHSFFIMPKKNSKKDTDLNTFYRFGVELCKAFDQESFGFGNGNKIFFVDQSGKRSFAGNALTFDDDQIKKLPGFSKVHHKKFSFVYHGGEHPEKVSVQYGIPQWWRQLNRPQQKHYLEDHPKSGLKLAASKGVAMSREIIQRINAYLVVAAKKKPKLKTNKKKLVKKIEPARNASNIPIPKDLQEETELRSLHRKMANYHGRQARYLEKLSRECPEFQKKRLESFWQRHWREHRWHSHRAITVEK